MKDLASLDGEEGETYVSGCAESDSNERCNAA